MCVRVFDLFEMHTSDLECIVLVLLLVHIDILTLIRADLAQGWTLYQCITTRSVVSSDQKEMRVGHQAAYRRRVWRT